MTNNKQQTPVEWLISQLQRSKDWHRILNEISQMSSARLDIIEQAKEMEAIGKEMSYAEGYKEGYNRAIELTKWTISNLIPPHNEQG